MKNLFVLILLSGTLMGIRAQNQQRIIRQQTQLNLQREYQIMIPPSVEQGISPTPGISQPPIGSTVTDAVTAIKIAETSNAYSTLIPEVNPVSVVNGTGNGGVISFVHRQNINTCGGTATDNGRVRYTYSADGGATWDVGSGVSVSNGVLAPPGHCFGVTSLTTAYTFPVRFPQGAMFFGEGGSNPDDLVLTHLGSILTPGPGGQWDGAEVSTVTGAAGPNFSLTQEEYLFTNVGHEINSGFVEGKPGEFWFVTREANGANNDPGQGRVFLYKGTYDANNDRMNWLNTHIFSPDHSLTFDGVPHQGNPSIAFSPDGSKGFISWLGDLNGGEDTVLSPVLMETLDGGNTWSTPVEINLNSFPEVADSMQWILVIDTTGGTTDTIPFATGKATVGFEHDLTVDVNGNPYMVMTIGPASHINSPQANYGIFSGLYLFTAVITRDTFGDFNIMHLASQSSFRAHWGDLTQAASVNVNIIQDVHPQASRSEDGTKVFFSWNDTDTTGIWSPIPGPPGSNDMTNYAPNLHTRGYDVISRKLTRVTNWTGDDANWGGRVLLPKMSPIALESTPGMFTLPVVITNIDGNDATLPCSYYYFSDVTVDGATDFTEDPSFFYNCKETPFANTVNLTAPSCGNGDGEISITPGGGLGDYSYQWDASTGGSTDSMVANLGAGQYSVTVMDRFGCSETLEIILNDANSPDLATDMASVVDISCFGAQDGAACVSVSGGTGAYTYLWSNGETDSCATTLLPGTNTLEVTDANGCKSFTNIQIQQPDSIRINSQTIDALDCFGDTDGGIEVNAGGGTGTLTYSWDNGQTGAAISGLGAGTYQLTVTDVNNCQLVTDVVLTEPDSLEASYVINPNTTSTPPFTGNVTANVTGGTAPYTITWTDETGAFISTGQFIFGLKPGKYSASVVDNNGCTLTDTAIVEGVNPTGIDDFARAGIRSVSVYPNPSAGVFTLELELENSDQAGLRILDLRGREIFASNLTRGVSWKETIDIQHLSSGFYLLEISTSKGSISKRLAID